MLKVNVKHGDINRALKEYKNKIIKTRQMSDINDRREFEKPSVKNRKSKIKGIYKQNKKREND